MKLVVVWLAALALVASASEVALENDGVIEFKLKHSAISCRGQTVISHPDYEIRSVGQLVLRYGASLKLAHPGADPSTVRARKELVSIVAIGDVEVTRLDGDKEEATRGARLVYLPAKGQWLIDGESWSSSAPR